MANYKCKVCGEVYTGNIELSEESKFTCPFCDSVNDILEIKKPNIAISLEEKLQYKKPIGQNEESAKAVKNEVTQGNSNQEIQQSPILSENFNVRLLDIVNEMNNYAYSVINNNAKHWAMQAFEKNKISYADKQEIMIICDLRNQIAHGNGDIISVTKEKVDKADDYLQLMKKTNL